MTSTRVPFLALAITAAACSSATQPDPNSPLAVIEDLGITIAPEAEGRNPGG